MNLEMFLRTIDVINLTALIADTDNLLRTRDGNPARIIQAYTPRTIKGDISAFNIDKIPDDPEVLAKLRQHIQDYISDDTPDFHGSNAFHLSNPCLWRNKSGQLTDFQYTVSFYKIE